jgi:hypothetical protein
LWRAAKAPLVESPHPLAEQLKAAGRFSCLLRGSGCGIACHGVISPSVPNAPESLAGPSWRLHRIQFPTALSTTPCMTWRTQMKVGIFLRDYLPEDGGCYTFSNEITNALLKMSTQCSHRFVVFGRNKQPHPALLLSDNIQYVYICSTYKQTVEHKISRTIIDFLKKLQHPLMSFSINPRQQMLVLDALSSNGIDILWEPGPNCLTMDLPYIITVWDLEHRVLPYFPEIDRECKWDLQEQHYATKLRRASFVITNTKAGKAQIEMFYQVPAERIKILPFPVPTFVSSTIPSTRNNIFAKYTLSDKYLFYPYILVEWLLNLTYPIK